MRVLKAGEFKARCLKIMDEVEARREPVLITKNGRPVARLVPAGKSARDAFGSLAGSIEIVGDIVAPAVPASEWDALR
jgi:prevent-host-death family protein